VLAACWSGDRARGEKALAPLRTLPGAHADVIGPAPYAAWQQAFDPLLVPGARNYWKTHNFTGLGDDLIDTFVAQVPTIPHPMSEIIITHLGGAVGRVADDETAYFGRGSHFGTNVHGRWDDAALDERVVEWARTVYRRTAPFAAPGAYVNFLTRDEGERVGAAYGPHFERLAAIKGKFDPTNFFRVNQNIAPRPSEPRSGSPVGLTSREEIRLM
jgi:hypothetical protein